MCCGFEIPSSFWLPCRSQTSDAHPARHLEKQFLETRFRVGSAARVVQVAGRESRARLDLSGEQARVGDPERRAHRDQGQGMAAHLVQVLAMAGESEWLDPGCQEPVDPEYRVLVSRTLSSCLPTHTTPAKPN
jgi:hypothetical protein